MRWSGSLHHAGGDNPGCTPENPGSGLSDLWLWSNRIGDAGAVALATAPHLQCLRFLALNDNKIGAAGVLALVSSPCLTSLWSLDLRNNKIGDEAVAALVSLPQSASPVPS